MTAGNRMRQKNFSLWKLIRLGILYISPETKSFIGSKWVYDIKVKSNGTLEQYKAQLVAQGFKQEYGIDSEKPFAPVDKMTAFRALLVVATACRWSMFQLDVENVLMHSDLHSVVYMTLPLVILVNQARYVG